MEMEMNKTFTMDAIEYIAKIADGGMRDAITLLDKCLAYSQDLTVENVISAIGAVDYDVLLQLTDALVYNKPDEMIQIIEKLHMQGKDLKLFVHSFVIFVLDLCKYFVTGTLEFTQLPGYYADRLNKPNTYFQDCQVLLDVLLHLNTDIKWDSNPKAMIEAHLYRFCLGDN